MPRARSRWITTGIGLGVLALAVLVAGRGDAFAQGVAPIEPTAHEHALQLFSESKKAYQQGDFRTAIRNLQAAFQIEPAAVLLYNLARAYEGVGELEQAVSAYERFLAADPGAEDRGAIEARVVTLRRQIEIQTQKLAPAPAQAPAPRPRSVLPLAAVAVGGAGLVAGAVCGGLALSDNRAQNAPTTSQLVGQNTHDRAVSLAAVSDVGLIAGGVLVAAGVVWWILDRSHAVVTRGAAATPLVVHF